MGRSEPGPHFDGPEGDAMGKSGSEAPSVLGGEERSFQIALAPAHFDEAIAAADQARRGSPRRRGRGRKGCFAYRPR
jgi:hypothetical protein